MKDFVVGRLKSLKYAVKGAYLLLTTEHSIMVQFSAGLLAAGLGFYFNISKDEWIYQILATAMVLSIEGLNTAIEKIADFIHPEFSNRIGFIKDIAAGAVTFSAVSAFIIFTIIYYPYIFS